jgi:hypothetical protein
MQGGGTRLHHHKCTLAVLGNSLRLLTFHDNCSPHLWPEEAGVGCDVTPRQHDRLQCRCTRNASPHTLTTCTATGPKAAAASSPQLPRHSLLLFTITTARATRGSVSTACTVGQPWEPLPRGWAAHHGPSLPSHDGSAPSCSVTTGCRSTALQQSHDTTTSPRPLAPWMAWGVPVHSGSPPVSSESTLPPPARPRPIGSGLSVGRSAART